MVGVSAAPLVDIHDFMHGYGSDKQRPTGNSNGFAGTLDSQQPNGMSLIPLVETESNFDLAESEGEAPLQIRPIACRD